MLRATVLAAAYTVHTLILMITIFIDSCNPISQKKYDDAISALQLHQLSCPCCGKASRMAFYGTYARSVKQNGELVELRIRRVICSECGSTHALLLSEIVPYSRTPLFDQADIISGNPAAVMERNPLVDENGVRSILRQFKKHWEQILLAADL